MSYGDVQAPSYLSNSGTGTMGTWQRDLRIITDTLPSFTDQQSTGSARASAAKLDPFCINYLHDPTEVKSGQSTPYVFTPTGLLLPGDGAFKLFPSKQPAVQAKGNNLMTQPQALPRVQPKKPNFFPDDINAASEVLMDDAPPYIQATSLQLNRTHRDKPFEAAKPSYQLQEIFLDNVAKEKRTKGDKLRDIFRTCNIDPTKEYKKRPSKANLCRDNLKKLVDALSRKEKDTLLQLLLQEKPVKGNGNDNSGNITMDKAPSHSKTGSMIETGIFTSSVDERTSNIPNISIGSMASDFSAQNIAGASDHIDSLVNSEIGCFAAHPQEMIPRHTPLQNKYEGVQSPEMQTSYTSPATRLYPHSFGQKQDLFGFDGEASTMDAPLTLDANTDYVVPSTPGYLDTTSRCALPHANSHYTFSGLGLANSLFDRRRPRQSYRATIYDGSPKAPKAFSEHDDNIILAAIFYYVGDYNTTDLNWHVIYYYHALLIYNNRSLSSLRSRFHKYLKIDFLFDVREYPLTYWLDLLDLCAHTISKPGWQHSTDSNGMLTTKQSKIHYLVASIFVLLRPDMQHNELKRNFTLWLELVNGPHSFL